MHRLQQAITPPIAADINNRRQDRLVEFFHPTYPNSSSPLLTLVAVDAGKDDTIGIDYELAKVACGIVAGNRWGEDTYFATKNRQDDQDTPKWETVQTPEDGILCVGTSYYFIVDHPANRYPVVPSFDHWRFPHGELPSLWATLCIPESCGLATGDADGRNTARNRDISCRITGSFENTEVAHLIPFAHKKWFESNKMERYCWLPDMVNTIDDETNLLLLRADIYGLLDRNRLVIVPKHDNPSALSSSPATLVIHAILPFGSREISQYYHNRALQSPVTGIRREHLFARFAQSLLCDENYKFLSGPHKYAVLLHDEEKGIQEIRDIYHDAIKDCSQIFPSAVGRTRSVSPKKRKAPPTQQAATSCWNVDGSSDEDETEQTTSDSETQPRGRIKN
ncbi:hypothetical protein F5X99DRAFT_247223 [Biscogniauxia marginata]|nr:hypothetical protein F5X99DRAFT_247223 [Biscogniauxia marginata]